MKLSKSEILDMMLSDTRIASWVRTEYRNMIDQESGTPATPDPKKTDAAKADEVAPK